MLALSSIESLNRLSATIFDGLLGATLLSSLLVAAIVLLFRLRPGLSAATRHFLLLLALVTPLVLPPLASVLPKWRIVPEEINAYSLGYLSEEAHQQALPIGSRMGQTSNNAAAHDDMTIGTVETFASPTASTFSLASWTCLAWITGVLASLAVWLAGWISLASVAYRCRRSPDPRIERMLASASKRIGVTRRVRLLLCDDRSMPMQWGTLRPTILLPTHLKESCQDTIETVLLHELAHIKRRDSIAHCGALLTRSLLWFHPLVWWAVARVRRDCERACDDLLLANGTSACDYADTLIEVTRWAQDSTGPMRVALGMSHTSELESRILGILDGSRQRYGLSRRCAWIIGISFACVVGAAAVLRSQDATAARPVTRAGSLIRVSHVDETAESYRSIAGSGHAVNLKRPAGANYVAAIELFASRYGTPTPPNEDFHIYLLDQNQQVIAAYPVAYSQIERGNQRWYTLPIRACKVPEKFGVAVAFNPHRTKGIYLGIDEDSGSSHSLVGRPTTGFESFDAGEWMIRAVIIDQPQPTNPFVPPDTPAPDNPFQPSDG